MCQRNCTQLVQIIYQISKAKCTYYRVMPPYLTISSITECFKVLVLILYTMYTAPLYQNIFSHSLSSHYCADDTELNVLSKPDKIEVTITSIKTWLSDIFVWLVLNNLFLNAAKTEFLVFGRK